MSRKLMISTGLGLAVGIAATIIGKDYDAVVMVILRVGTLCAVVFGAIFVAHHVLTRKAGSNRAPKVDGS